MTELSEAADGVEPLPLDPFGACPERASLIVGLGGPEPSPDPTYVMTTPDFRPAIGRVHITVCFHDLAISHGTLLFEIRGRSGVPGAQPSRLKTIIVEADELLAASGVVDLAFDSYRNTYYVIACSINDETNIAASAISILLDREAGAEEHSRDWQWAPGATGRRPGVEAALISRVMTDLERPQLESPQSQVGSPAQCHEPAFIAAMHALDREPVGSFENWSLAFVMRAINRFAAGGPHRMLGIGQGQTPLLSYFAGQGHEVVGLQHMEDSRTPFDPGAVLGQLWVPELCDEATFFNRAHVASFDIRRSVEALNDQFDIMWSIGANRLMTPQEYVYFVVNGLIQVRPGALAVHVFDYLEDADAENGTSLTRHDIERTIGLALSHAHDAARLRFLHGAPPLEGGTPLPFGLVLLRAGAQS